MPLTIESRGNGGSLTLEDRAGLGNIAFIQNVITPTGSSNIVTDGLILHLDASNATSYPGSGVTWVDLVGDYDATINGATWSSTDGGLFDFDGINDTISIPHSSSLSLSTISQKTIQIWVKFDAAATSTNRRILFSKLSGGFAFDGYFGGIDINRQAVVATNGTGIARTTTSTLTVDLDTWYLFTFISQITSVANTTKIYINGTEYGSSAHGTDGYSEANPLTFGYMPAPLTGLGGIQYLDGKIGAVYFYTKGLSEAEILENYNATKTRFGL
jgi:hypothetical protein